MSNGFRLGAASDGRISVDDWPNCIVPDCPNKCCLRLKSDKCWPHTVGAPVGWAVGKSKADRDATAAALEVEWKRRNTAKAR